MLVLFVGWGLFFIYTLWRFRAGRQQKAEHDGVKSHASSYVEISVIIIEFILLIGFSIPLWAHHVEGFPDENEEDVTDVRIIAQQFVWNVHFPGADGIYGEVRPDLVDPETNPIGLNTDDPHAEDDIWTVNDLRFPVGKPVVARLRSLDVIHSFYLPQMRVKQDVIPGMEIPAWFVPVKETPEGANWQIACAQLCGVGHYRMAGKYMSVSQEDFDAWYEARHTEMVEEAEADDW
jgi:cytochrome c oxidase subunit 2